MHFRIHHISATAATFLTIVSSASSSPPAQGRTLDILHALSPKLSSGAQILFPDDQALWHNSTDRWDKYAQPTLRASVEVATAHDVQETVKYAVARNVPLLVKNTGHGFTSTVQEYVVDGIQISLGRLNSIEVDEERMTVKVGGGVVNFYLIEELFKKGLRTSTGGCDCVGLMGLGLGGGHGKMQGRFGLVADVILSFTLVTASGNLLTVSATSHPDLFWALRGAGHNFGIVVSATLKVFRRPDSDTWVDATYLFPAAALPNIVAHLNEIRLTQHDLLTVFTGFARNDTNPAEPATIRVSVQYGGGADTFGQHEAPLIAMGPLSRTVNTHAYNRIAAATGIGLNAGLCIVGETRRAHYSAQLRSLSLPALQKAYELYDEIVHAPQWARFIDTFVVYESYPLRKFQRIAKESTAYPHRDLSVTSMFMINYVGSDPQLKRQADVLGNRGRDILVAGADTQGKKRLYVNYALGNEGAETWYYNDGGESRWRERRLKALKKKWDSAGVWRAYNPIVL